MSTQDFTDFPILPLSSTYSSSSLSHPQVNSLFRADLTEASPSKAVAAEPPKHLVEVYFKAEVQVEETGNHYAAMKRDLTLGPFHSLFGPVPFDATIVKKIDSPFLETLLSHFKILASDYLIPPTTIEMPTILESFTKWEERYPHILYNVVFVARGEWKRRLKELDKSINWDKAIYTDWAKLNPVDQLLSEDDVGEWAEAAMYLQIEKKIHESYLSWCKYSIECLLSIEHEKIKAEHSSVSESLKRFALFLGGAYLYEDPPKRPTLNEMYDKAEGRSSFARINRYDKLPPYDQYSSAPSTSSTFTLEKYPVEKKYDFYSLI